MFRDSFFPRLFSLQIYSKAPCYLLVTTVSFCQRPSHSLLFLCTPRHNVVRCGTLTSDVCIFFLSLELGVVSMMFLCPAHHVLDWQRRILLGMVKARSVNVKNTTQQQQRTSTGHLMSPLPHNIVDKFPPTPARLTRVLPACGYALGTGNERSPCSIIATSLSICRIAIT